MRTLSYARFVAICAATLVVFGCGRDQLERVSVPPGKPMPAWYKGVDPEPDDANYYFTGYFEGAARFDQARDLAANNARASAARYLGTEVVENVITEMEQQGTDWGNVFDDQSKPAAGDSGVPSQTKDTVRQKLQTMVAESIRMARIKDLYVEQVTQRRRGSGTHIRFDAGVLIEFPKAEVERLRSLEALKVSDKQEVNDMVRRAETMWSAGEKEQALETMQKARRMYPNDMGVAMQLAQYYEDLGRSDDALKIYSTVSEVGGNTDQGRLATGKVTSMTNARFANYLKLLESHDIRGQDLVAVLTDVKDGQVTRARERARESYEADVQNSAMLYAWMMTAIVDAQKTNSMAAKYDAQKAAEKANEARAQWKEPKESEGAVAALLGMVQQDVGTKDALDELGKIKKKFPTNPNFSPEIGDMAAATLGTRQDKQSQDLSEWLNRK